MVCPGILCSLVFRSLCDIFFLEMPAEEKFAKIGLHTLAFAVLTLDPYFIDTDGPIVLFTESGQCVGSITLFFANFSICAFVHLVLIQS